MASDKSMSPVPSLGVQAATSIQEVLQKTSASTVSHCDMYDRALVDHSAESLAKTIVAFITNVLGLEPERMVWVINLAADLHSTKLRHGENNGPKPYIVHPLRNTLRLLRLGAVDLPLLMASVLHDTVEDHPFELAAKAGVQTEDEEQARETALSFLSATFGSETAQIVEGMSNPLLKDQTPTREQIQVLYFDHVREATMDPRVFACKVSDFIDNAVGLAHEEGLDPARLLRMAKKYYPVFQVLMDRLNKGEADGDLPISIQGVKEVRSQLEIGRERLGKIVHGN